MWGRGLGEEVSKQGGDDAAESVVKVAHKRGGDPTGLLNLRAQQNDEKNCDAYLVS